jgi:hypothetical protein
MMPLKTSKGVPIMSAPVTTATGWQWPEDVLALATEHHVEQYLDPLRELVRQLFPTTRALDVYAESDPEIRADRYLVYHVQVPAADVPAFRVAYHRWGQAAAGLHSALVPLVHLRLDLTS